MKLLLKLSTVSEWLTLSVNSPAEVVLSPLCLHVFFLYFHLNHRYFKANLINEMKLLCTDISEC